MDSLQGGPLAGATVLVVGTSQQGVTDSGGVYRIDSVPAGAHPLEVVHPVLDAAGLRVVTTPVAFVAGRVRLAIVRTPSSLTLRALRCWDDDATGGVTPDSEATLGAVIGRVVDRSTDAPVPGATVTLAWWELSIDRGIRRTTRSRTATTNAQGTFRLCGVTTPFAGRMQATQGTRATAVADVTLARGGLVIATLHLLPMDSLSAR
jgi:hypothetical protein